MTKDCQHLLSKKVPSSLHTAKFQIFVLDRLLFLLVMSSGPVFCMIWIHALFNYRFNTCEQSKSN